MRRSPETLYGFLMDPTSGTDRRVFWVAGSIVFALALLSAIGLSYLRPALFQFENAFPATITYFGLFALLVLGGRTHIQKVKPKRRIDVVPELSEEDSWGNSMLAEFGLFLFLALISASIGAVSGVVWWGAGGYATHTLLAAISVGAVIGALTVVFLFAGP